MAIYISIVGVAISIVGWFVVHVLAIRTQRLALINSLRNEARIAITDSIHDYHDCCAEILATANSASVDEILASAGVETPQTTRSRRIRESLLDTRTYIWLRRLEEFESIFPETADVRVELLRRNSNVLDRMRAFADQYESGATSHNSPVFEEIVDDLYDLISLSWDLLIFVQNRSFGEITGYKVPQRQPIGAHHPILTAADSGKLGISHHSNKN